MPSERIGFGRYRLRVPDATEHVLIVPQDGYGGIRDGVVLARAQLAATSVCSVTMPPGADVVVDLPDDVERTVLVEGAFGARTVLARGRFVLRSVPAGTLSASCRIGERGLRDQVEVAGVGRYHLTLSR